jgi:hypothetical protein
MCDVGWPELINYNGREVFAFSHSHWSALSSQPARRSTVTGLLESFLWQRPGLCHSLTLPNRQVFSGQIYCRPNEFYCRPRPAAQLRPISPVTTRTLRSVRLQQRIIGVGAVGVGRRRCRSAQAAHQPCRALQGVVVSPLHCATAAAPHTVMKKLRIVILRFGTARQKMVLE